MAARSSKCLARVAVSHRGVSGDVRQVIRVDECKNEAMNHL